MKERATPWDPIPHRYNRIADIHVGESTELGDPTHEELAILVTYTSPGRMEQERMWRITFDPPRAYRVRGVGAWTGALPLTRPKAHWAALGGQVAIWEVVHSQFIRETVQPDVRWRVRHYVLMSQDVAYEFVADKVRVEILDA